MIPETFIAKYYWQKQQGESLKKIIKAKKMTYEQLSNSIGYPSRQQVLHLVNARTGIIDSTILDKLCTVLEVEKSFFYPTITINKKLFD